MVISRKACEIVGASTRSGEGSAFVTASTFTCLLRMAPSRVASPAIMKSMWPPVMSVSACAAPLNGTCMISTFV